MVTRSERCDCTVGFKNGMTQRCVQRGDYEGKCYLHHKYFAGLCSPTEFDDDASIPKSETVEWVKDSRGNVMNYGN